MTRRPSDLATLRPSDPATRRPRWSKKCLRRWPSHRPPHRPPPLPSGWIAARMKTSGLASPAPAPFPAPSPAQASPVGSRMSPQSSSTPIRRAAAGTTSWRWVSPNLPPPPCGPSAPSATGRSPRATNFRGICYAAGVGRGRGTGGGRDRGTGNAPRSRSSYRGDAACPVTLLSRERVRDRIRCDAMAAASSTDADQFPILVPFPDPASRPLLPRSLHAG